MRLLGSIALLHALPPHVHVVGRSAAGRVGTLAPQISIAPSLHSLNTAEQNTSVTTIAPGLTSTPVSGNLLLALCQVIGSGKTFSVGGGWTIGDTAANGAACWAWRYADGTEADPVFTWSGAANCSAVTSEWTGVKSSGAIGNSAKASGSGTSVSLSGIVTGADLSRVVGFVCAQTSQTISPSSGFTNNGRLASANGSFIVESEAVPVVASSGTISNTISSAAWEAFLIEIKSQ